MISVAPLTDSATSTTADPMLNPILVKWSARDSFLNVGLPAFIDKTLQPNDVAAAPAIAQPAPVEPLPANDDFPEASEAAWASRLSSPFSPSRPFPVESEEAWGTCVSTPCYVTLQTSSRKPEELGKLGEVLVECLAKHQIPVLNYALTASPGREPQIRLNFDGEKLQSAEMATALTHAFREIKRAADTLTMLYAPASPTPLVM